MTAEGAGHSFEDYREEIQQHIEQMGIFPDERGRMAGLLNLCTETVNALREDNQRLREIEKTARQLVDLGRTTYGPNLTGVVISPRGWDALQAALTPPEEVER